MISTEQLADVFVDVADTLVDDFDLIDFLHKLADHAAAISGAASVGLMLADHTDQLSFVASSSAAAQHLELIQLQNDEGPCLDCFRNRTPVIVSDLSAALERWPKFAPLAMAAGLNAVHAFPMRLRDRTIGAMNIFGAVAQPLEPRDVQVIQALADVATIAIIQERSIARAETLTEQLQGALNSRIVIEQAKGSIAQALGLSVDQAFEVLRTRARRNELRLTDLAHRVVTGAVDIADL
ncbi:GAF and ANTAR domain-containing protein [Microlunatus speluncae]|uniref:GAF and ANTAR domain-containing protein n=1 Tax=Microlunatus speluncae TaxID=2594267 RepID=UPI001581E217|nr:GAF and ANTAR domain-containing protein [Microlunatus speluncae]